MILLCTVTGEDVVSRFCIRITLVISIIQKFVTNIPKESMLRARSYMHNHEMSYTCSVCSRNNGEE